MAAGRPGRQSLVIEGYASLFGIEDLMGDVVRAGAFARSLARNAQMGGMQVGMLLAHVGGRTAGRWSVVREDGRGLFVRGLVTDETAAGAAALQLIGEGELSGLSIGFVARDWSPRVAPGRDLKEIELREISLVSSPMLLSAQFAVVGDVSVKRAA